MKKKILCGIVWVTWLSISVKSWLGVDCECDALCVWEWWPLAINFSPCLHLREPFREKTVKFTSNHVIHTCTSIIWCVSRTLMLDGANMKRPVLWMACNRSCYRFCIKAQELLICIKAHTLLIPSEISYDCGWNHPHNNPGGIDNYQQMVTKLWCFTLTLT